VGYASLQQATVKNHMQTEYTIPAYDVMAVGMTHRIVVGAAPQIRGETMRAKQAYLEHNLDRLRARVVSGASDPPDLIGVLVTEPVCAQADVGIIYFVRQGYWAMCGSGTFALGVFLVESGLIDAVEPVTEVTLELATGLMRLSAEVEAGRVVRVSTVTEPVFYLCTTKIDLQGYGQVAVDVSYCLNYFEPMLDARQLGVEVTLENRPELERIGLEVRRIVNETVPLRHPTDSTIDRAVQVQIYDPESATEGIDCRCVAIYGIDGFDLTPSGTSTCAHMAAKRARGELAIGERFVMESVTGAAIVGTVLADKRLGDVDAIVPQIAGSAQITRMVSLLG